MAGARLVLPNLASLPQRGDLAARWALARQLGLDAVEMPADLVKSRREERMTGQPIGAVPNEDAVVQLYRPGAGARYVLHTDPGIPRRDGAVVVPELRWNDDRWTAAYASFLVQVAERLGPPPEVVEVHAGRESSVAEVVKAMTALRDRLSAATGAAVTVAVENKPGQAVATVDDILRAAELMNDEDGLGIMLDVPNLWKAGRRRAERGIGSFPHHRLVGMHVHENHRAPALGGAVDWPSVRQLLQRTGRPVLINPEVFHRGELLKALRFVREELLGSAPNPHKGGGP